MNADERPVLVLGPSGFVGSHTARRLVELGRKVRILARKSSNIESLRGLPVEICNDPPKPAHVAVRFLRALELALILLLSAFSIPALTWSTQSSSSDGGRSNCQDPSATVFLP